MGLNYRKRPRGQELNVAADDNSLIGYSMSDSNINFEKHDIEDVVRIVNKKLDEAERRLNE